MTKAKQAPTRNWLRLRETLGYNQSEFWERVGVTQSAGSRYENGRQISTRLNTLLTIAYGTEAQAEAVIRKLRAG